MKAGTKVERRREKRYPQNIDVLVRELPGCDEPELGSATTKPGRIQNVSTNGLCLLTFQPIRPLAIVRCEFPVCDSGIRIPTLMHVRWTRQQSEDIRGYISGLEALL
ncbi:PilZ domain-containing protein [Occallatibacter riparius]|uniref:PilZ domain-containing protein n=1 Tax=Occallatibacter riparius TaxID=1002689 RepID=A0A9J7BKZ4_9BACT|nr:PilZ domain-containing protein [Occallatibacter riparius]UWZ81925.1 PilZ domain-containing protein [Occallatibacter riparius]